VNNQRNYYRILHVQPDAPEAIIRASYRTLMQKLRAHPDLGGDHWNAALINEAFSILSDATQRAAYDRQLFERFTEAELGAQHASRRRPTDHSRAEPPPAERPRPGHWCRFCKTPHLPLQPGDEDPGCRGCGSPIGLARRERKPSGSKRGVERLEKELAMAFYDHWPQDRPQGGRIKNLSTDGLCFVAPVELDVGQVIKIESGLLKAVGQISNRRSVRRTVRVDFVYGVLFLSLRFMRQSGTFVSTQV